MTEPTTPEPDDADPLAWLAKRHQGWTTGGADGQRQQLVRLLESWQQPNVDEDPEDPPDAA